VRRFAVALLLASCASPPPRPPTEVDRGRFLYFALLEGLWEDGAPAEALKPLLAAPRDHFVPKCPVCTPVTQALADYANTTDIAVYGGRGKGFPPEIEIALRSGVRDERRRGLESLVARYVDRRFERVRMTSGERFLMKALIDEGRQDGMSMMEPGFGPACPSCSGATRSR
jgi:hypothetical protein